MNWEYLFFGRRAMSWEPTWMDWAQLAGTYALLVLGFAFFLSLAAMRLRDEQRQQAHYRARVDSFLTTLATIRAMLRVWGVRPRV